MPVLDRITSDLSVPNVGVGNGMKGDKASICFVDKLSDPGCRSNLSRFERRIQNLFNFYETVPARIASDTGAQMREMHSQKGTRLHLNVEN